MKSILFLFCALLFSSVGCGATAEQLAAIFDTQCSELEGCDAKSAEVESGMLPGDAASMPVQVDAIPASLCQGDEDRFAISAITPRLGSVIPANLPVTFTATVNYYVTGTQTVSLRVFGVNVSSATVQPGGCKNVVLTGTRAALNTSDSQAVTTVPAGQSELYYEIVMPGEDYTRANVNSLSVPRGTIISSPTFRFSANLSLDMNGLGYENGSNPDDAYLSLWEDTGAGLYWVDRALAISTMELDVPLWGTLACGDTFVRFGYKVDGDGGVIAERSISLPAIPPEVTIDNFLTGYPVNATKTATIEVSIEDCVGGRELTLTPSADFFDVSPTVVSGGNSYTITVTYHGDRLSPRELTTGFLLIEPVDGSFEPVAIDVSARGFDYDFYSDGWTRLGIEDQDDDAGIIDLPFDFPYNEGRTTDRVYASSNGTLSLDGGYFDEYWSFVGNYEADASYFGVNFIAPLWRDNDTYTYDTGASDWDLNDVYYREVGSGTARERMEIVWWDFHPLDTYLIHNVVKVTLYPSGLFSVTFDQLDSTGMETVGYFNDDLGLIHDFGMALDLEEGVPYEYLIP